VRSVEDLVATLSEEEREQFRELIEDTRRREQQIRANARRAEQALAGLEAAQRQFDREVRRLNGASQRALDAVTTACLRTIDWSKVPTV
jgi:uncharacterized membrane protein